MKNFRQRFEIIYEAYVNLVANTGAKPSKLAFSRFLGVAQGTMQNWDYNGTVPSGKDLKTIHDKLGFSYDWLISGEGEPMDRTHEKVEALEAEVQRLRTRLFVEGSTDKDVAPNTNKASGEQG